ncbi:spermatogenesis-defective protein 39 homolog [Saccoglossus kowalevskii]|uniref:Spermatogenesis-defective protein 39 homolog n=1 Tax=Saccoglossus kowalevskii TaxID=10224 RepID=A0ABM0M0S3_SACKO|nr:PREDICTED: spermatogenesis-defective protein 39 homolog [Saccoglossus kowalevskii]
MASWKKSTDKDDSYWNQTSKETLTNPFDFEDNVTEFDDTRSWLTVKEQEKASELSKNIRQAVNFDDDDDVDVISWDGANKDYKSARYRPPTSVNESKTIHASLNLGSSAAKTQSFSSSLNYSKTSSQGSTKPVSGYSDELSISEIVNAAQPKRQATLTEITKLETEVRFLQRSLESAKRDRFAVLPPRDTIKRLIYGDPCSLEMYKSLTDKLALLDAAVEMHDGNAITAVVLFLKNTLHRKFFISELIMRPVAINHYLHYLKCHFELSEMGSILRILGRTEEAAMLHYKMSIVKMPADRLRNLKNTFREYFKHDTSLSEATPYLEDHCALLERQIAIEQTDVHLEKEGKHIMFKEVPRVTTLPFLPVITTLFYCCMYHYEAPDNDISSPFSMRRDFKLTENQFLYTALTARTKLRRWRDIETMLTAKGWFGGTKMKASIGFEKVIDILSKMNAPPEVMGKYIMCIDNTELRLSLANKLNCHGAVIDTLVQMKDRQQLQKYGTSGKLKYNSPDMIKLDRALRSTGVKWKN